MEAAPNAPEQLQMTPTVIGAPAAACDPPDVVCDPPDVACDPTVGEVLDFLALDPQAATVRITARKAVRHRHLLALLTVATPPRASSFVNGSTSIE
jgi:hypothetical protein